MKKILISIRPEWVAKILSGEKTIEVRKTAPKCKLPCEVYIYCTKGNGTLVYIETPDTGFGEYSGYTYYADKRNISFRSEIVETFNGKVVAKFTLNKVEAICCEGLENGCGGHNYFYSLESGEDIRKKACLDEFDLRNYLGTKLDGDEVGYAWHIDQKSLVIFDKPKELKEFKHPCEHKDLDCEECVKLRVEGKLKDKPNCHYGTSIDKAPQSYCYCEVEE